MPIDYCGSVMSTRRKKGTKRYLDNKNVVISDLMGVIFRVRARVRVDLATYVILTLLRFQRKNLTYRRCCRALQ